MWDNLSHKFGVNESLFWESSDPGRLTHRRRNPEMFKGLGALPQRAKKGWVITQTLLAQNMICAKIEKLNLAKFKFRLK